MLLRRLIVVSFILAVVFALLSVWGIERVRYRDRVLAIERMAATHTTDLVQARCEANPNWFLAGPREASPSAAMMALPDADVLAPRPDAEIRPVEFFAYDVEYIGQSTAAPRLPQPMRAALRSGVESVTMAFETSEGTGVQTAFTTGWGGVCNAILFRMHPPPGQFFERVRMFAYLTFGGFVVVMLVVWPVDRRVRVLGTKMRASARTEYQDPAHVFGRDEISSLGFSFNEAGGLIRRLQTDAIDREADFRRFVSHLGLEVDEPLRAAVADADPAQLTELALHLSNLLVGARFRDAGPRVNDNIDVGEIARQVTAELEPAARKRGVQIQLARADAGVQLQGDPVFLTQALRNLIAHSLKRMPGGGKVHVHVERQSDGQVRLRVSDTGPNLSGADLRELNAVRRFRGDEGRGAGLRGDIGLGLAVVHEACHRFALQLKFSSSTAGGLQVELTK